MVWGKGVPLWAHAEASLPPPLEGPDTGRYSIEFIQGMGRGIGKRGERERGGEGKRPNAHASERYLRRGLSPLEPIQGR